VTGSTLRVVVVGAGIVGSWTAYELARAGCSVVVLDAEPTEAHRSASFGNGGILAQSYAKPMSNPQLLWAGVRSILGGGHEVEVVRPLGADTLRWMLRFGLESRPGRARAAAPGIYASARRSLEMYDELAARESVDLQLRRTGWLYVAQTVAALGRQQRLAAELEPIGVRSSMVGAQDLRALEPALEPSLVGGVLFPDDISIDPALVVAAVREAATRHGADFVHAHVTSARLDGKAVRALVTDDGEAAGADRFVIAAGAQSAVLGRAMGVRIPVERGAGWSLTVATDEPLAGRALMGIEDHVLINPGQRSVRITGGMRFGGPRGGSPSAERLAALRAAAERILPPLAEVRSRGEGWTGDRPMTASGVPLVQCVNATTVVATGHGTLGMLLAPQTGEQVRQLILG
jgi:D-amino-acid dehydrogenase